MPRTIEQAQIEELIRKVRTVAREIDWRPGYGTWATLSDALEAKGFLTITGARWYHARGGAMVLKRFIRQHCPDLLISGSAKMRKSRVKPSPVKKSVQPKSEIVSHRGTTKGPSPKAADTPRGEDRVPQLDAETVEVLRELAEWWKERQKQTEAGPTYKPRFKGKTVTRTIRIPVELEKAVLKKAKTLEEHARTGGKLGGLVNWLLWAYVDYDPALVKHEQGEGSTEE